MSRQETAAAAARHLCEALRLLEWARGPIDSHDAEHPLYLKVRSARNKIHDCKKLISEFAQSTSRIHGSTWRRADAEVGNG